MHANRHFVQTNRTQPARHWSMALMTGVVLLCSGLCHLARAQPVVVPESVQLSFPGEVEVSVLADFISERLKISIVYDETIRNKKITIRSPEPIPIDSLLDLLKSTLRMKGMTLVDGGAPGWLRIVQANRLADVAQFGSAETVSLLTPVTETFALRHVTPQQVNETITQFLTNPGANSIAVRDSRLLIVTDYAGNLTKIRELIKSLDQAEPPPVTDFYLARNLTAAQIVQTVTPILAAGKATPQGTAIQLLADPRTNQIAIVGRDSEVLRAKALLERFDVPLGLQTQVYQFRSVPAARLNTIFQELIDPLSKETLYQATVDEDANLLIVRTTVDLHQQLEKLRQQIDVAPEQTRSPVRFVKLKNANVDEVLQTLKAIGEMGGLEGGAPVPGKNGAPAAINPDPQTSFQPMPNAFLAQNPFQPFYLPFSPQDARDNLPGAGTAPRVVGGGALLPGNIRVSADPLTNSLVLVGDPAEQGPYLELIEKLDAPRPQVMIEAHIIAIDTSDNFALGVEVSIGDRQGAKRLFKFTSFGLSEVDPVTGALQIIPNLGFNGTLVDPDIADVVVQALAAHTRAHVLASPKILVNDNTRGRFESVLSVPFQSVNASQTVSTTSLGGNQQAGTSIDVTPHIKEGNELELEFDIEFSSFSGSGSAALPPPRQISRVESIVTIPDGHAVIVGGLKQIGDSSTFTGVPFAELIPIIRDLTSLQTRDTTTTSFFLFIKPVVVRDDQFAELKHLTRNEVQRSQYSPRFPSSAPVLLRVAPAHVK